MSEVTNCGCGVCLTQTCITRSGGRVQAYEQAQAEPEISGFHNHPVTCRVDENRQHRELAGLCGLDTLHAVPALPSALNSTAMSRLQGRPVIRSSQQLRLHPELNTLGWTGVIDDVNYAARLKNQSVLEPILVTTNGIILVGIGAWRSALFEGKLEIRCIEYSISDTEALQFILAHHQTRRGWNAFVRIRLALTLEPYFQRKAIDNMSAGGRYKGSSNLTEAGRVDVRIEIASAAGVSAGNVTKVKQLMKSATVDVLQALRNGDISIHRAWLWSQEAPEKQRDALWRYQSEKGVKKTIRNLLRQQRPEDSPLVLSVDSLARRLSTLDSSELDPIRVVVTDVPGRAVFLSEELLRTIGLKEELTLK